MELRHLQYFLSVAEFLNFTKAAAKLRVAQPSLSRQIRDLEEELGVSLFERNSRIVRLTDAGKDFVAEANAVLSRAQEAVKSAQAFAKGDRGEIHIGFAPSLTVEVLPKILSAFERKYPNVRVTLHDLSIQEMQTGLKQRRLHAAMTTETSPKQMAGIKFVTLRVYPICVALGVRHRLARARSISLTEIPDERLLIYARAEYPEYHEWLSYLLRDRTGHSLEAAEEHDSGPSLIAAIEAGRGIAILPSVIESVAGSRLRFRRISPPPEPMSVGIAYLRANLSPAASRFVEAAVGLRA